MRPQSLLLGGDEKSVDDCETILDAYSQSLKLLNTAVTVVPRNTSWAHGRKHVFLSEGARQMLESMREARRNEAAIAVQKTWRGWRVRRGAAKAGSQQQVSIDSFDTQWCICGTGKKPWRCPRHVYLSNVLISLLIDHE